MKKKWVILMTIVAALSVNSCYYDKEELLYPDGGTPTTPGGSACGTTPASFSADILPLITSNCAVQGCHDATASGGFIFQNYSQISAAKDQINTQAVVQKTMPQTGPLPSSDINKLKCWIENGALNN